MDTAAIAGMLREDRHEWSVLVAALDACPDGPLHDPESPAWTARDVYAHLARWINNSTDAFDSWLANRTIPTPPQGNDDEINARWQAEDSSLTLDETRARAQHAFDRRIRAIESVPADRWDDVLDQIAHADDAVHYRAHRSYIAAARTESAGTRPEVHMADPTTELVTAGYDAVYAAMRTSPTLLKIWRQHALGGDYPEGFEPISFLSRAELDRMAALLQLQHGQTLVDLGCGLAGPSLWLARESGASLVGVDLSAVAIAAAAARATELGLAGQARFVTGSFAHTSLADGAAHACVSVDALQYAPDKQAAFAEAARILRPGGRLVFTAFEFDRERAAGLPVVGLDPVDDYAPLLRSAGFSPLVYEETPDWWQRVRSTYEAIMAAAALLTEELGPLAWQSLSSEVSLTLERQFYRRHVFVVAAREQD